MLQLTRNRPQDLSDEALLLRYRKSGELDMLGVLYERYMELVYGVGLKYLKAEDAAEDAVMAIFEELTQKVKQHEVQNFRSWLYVLARNHCLMKLRKQQRNLTVSFEPEFMQSEEGEHPTFEWDNLENGQLEALRSCIGELPEQQRHCIEQFYYEGKSYKEIADLLNEDVGKVRSFIQNGRRNLKICMEKKDKILDNKH